MFEATEIQYTTLVNCTKESATASIPLGIKSCFKANALCDHERLPCATPASPCFVLDVPMPVPLDGWDGFVMFCGIAGAFFWCFVGGFVCYFGGAIMFEDGD